jgi:hypothetical protein
MSNQQSNRKNNPSGNQKKSNFITVTFQGRINPQYPKDGPNPFISIANYEQDIAQLQNQNEIVIPMKVIYVRFTYPLKKAAKFKITAVKEEGLTRAELVRSICETYHLIYKREDEDVGGPTGTINPMMLNRAQSNGRYGIYGHYIEDLLLHTVRQVSDDTFELGIDS